MIPGSVEPCIPALWMEPTATGQALAAGLSPDVPLAPSQRLALPSAGQLTAAMDSLSPEPFG